MGKMELRTVEEGGGSWMGEILREGSGDGN